MTKIIRSPELDSHYSFCGPCAFCGHPDKRHRLWDALIDSPETEDMLVREYGVTLEHVKAVRRIRPYRRKRRA